VIKFTREMFVFMLTTGRILGGLPTSLNIRIFNVQSGNKKRILKHTKTDANLNIVADSAMAGKNLNIIQCCIRLQNAEELLKNNALNPIALTFIIKKNEGYQIY